MKKKILITGGAGFVGSSLAVAIRRKYPSYEVVCMDNLKRRGSELNLPRLKDAGITFVHGDIRNKEDFESCGNDITTLIEASAEPSILAGLSGSPEYLVNTNLLGTINCLYFAARVKADFLFISTSRIYPIENIEKIGFEEKESRFELKHEQSLAGVSVKGISEKFPIDGYRSLYGATKLCSEFMIHEFNAFFNLKTVINRCGVITGPWQMGKVDQGVVVLWVAHHYWKKDLSYFGYGGEGKQVRDILHVDDLFNLLDYQMHTMNTVNGMVFNAGGGREVSVSLRELTALCENVTGNKVTIHKVKEDRKADIRLYLTDNSLVENTCHWMPKKSSEQIVQDIFEWIKTNESTLKPILIG